MRTCVVFNPAAKGDKARRFQRFLDSIAHQADLRPTRHAGHARTLAAEAARAGFQTIVAAGGDGTLNEVVNGLADVPEALAATRLGFIPLGTVNVFALELGIPLAPERAWKIIQQSKERRIDLPEAHFQNNGAEERRCFVQLAGAGLDARAVKLVSWTWKKRIGPLAYLLSGVQALNEPAPPVTLATPQASAAGDFIMIGNGRSYGGRFPFLHRAAMTDGKLDAVVFERCNWGSLPGHLLQFMTGRYFRPSRLPYFQAAELELRSDRPAPLQLDGELVGHLPARFSVRPNALRILVP